MVNQAYKLNNANIPMCFASKPEKLKNLEKL